MVDEKTLISSIKKISKYNPDILTVTILDDASTKNLKDNLIKMFRNI
jgi:hypothetical protein